MCKCDLKSNESEENKKNYTWSSDNEVEYKEAASGWSGSSFSCPSGSIPLIMGGSGGGVGSLVDVVVQLVGAPVRANFSMLSSSSILSFSSTDLI